MRKHHKAETRKPEILENYYHVLIEEGFEGASIGKIAQRMKIHPSLIIHYFKNKENLTAELAQWLIRKYEAPEYLQFDHIQDMEQRLHALIDTIFSFEWSRTVDPGVHFGFYYLSYYLRADSLSSLQSSFDCQRNSFFFNNINYLSILSGSL